MSNLNRIEIIGMCLDILTILAPLTLLLNDPLSTFTSVFYFIYLPNLIFNIIKKSRKKKILKSIDSQFSKIIDEDFFIHQ